MLSDKALNNWRILLYFMKGLGLGVSVGLNICYYFFGGLECTSHSFAYVAH
jgi:hypothetical protein